MEYKSTLNLPQTDFPMKANLADREPQILVQWQKMGLYDLLCQANRGKELFILHDGPPYANGPIHIGHALNKILKDVIVRYKTMRGFDAPYIPGWDCHGLPVEHQLFKELKITKDQIDRVEFRKKAFAYAAKYVDIQKKEFERLGISGDWEHPYLTIDKGYEQAILLSFGQLVEKGFVYRGLKPVNWCFKCETALAEAEVEYADHESDSIFVKFELKSDEKSKKLGIPAGQESSILIWTTTPWTLIANVAVAVHPDLGYVFVRAGTETFILAKALFAVVRENLGIKDHEILAEVRGKDLEGLVYKHPLGLREGKVVLADYVSKEEGTGCVHTAPGHGPEDFATGLKYGLEVIMPVDERGKFDATAGDFSKMHVFDANEKIIQKLKQLKKLPWNSKITHTYPHCWRCKNPIIFRATHQWFLKIDHKDLRKELLEVIHKDITWIPASGEERIASMVDSRPDWCLSRQRYWGVPIPAVICKKCHEHILDARVIRILAERSSTEGSDAWFKEDVSVFLPADLKCSCGASAGFERSTDILDVWFDSGVSHQAVLKGKPGLKLPADLYLEGSDQHRGWFQASLIPSMAIDGKPPFKAVLTHGFVVDGEGRKMSKSLGNVISPQEILKDYGADILRLWVLSSDYNEDVRISKEILTFITDAYRKIRNTVRFLLGNLSDFNPGQDRAQKSDMLSIDLWALSRLAQLLDVVTGNYEEYKFYHVFQSIYAFCNEEMSSLYLDILKDRLYTGGKRSKSRRAAQTVLYEILDALTKILAPVLPFTCEEIYRCMHRTGHGLIESIHAQAWPRLRLEYKVSEEEAADLADIAKVLEFRPNILKALEEKRAKGEIGSPLEAKVIATFKEEKVFGAFKANLEQLPFLFIVSQFEISQEESLSSSMEVSIVAADGKKCSRCWNYSPEVDKDKDHPGLCGRCLEAIK